MTIYERLNELKNVDFAASDARILYNETEAEIIKLVAESVLGAEVLCQSYGTGKVVACFGDTLELAGVEIEFTNLIKKFSLQHIVTVGKYIKFADIAEIGDIWDAAMEAHTEITTKFRAYEILMKRQQFEAAKKAEAEKKAEAKYQKMKEKAIQDFDNLVAQSFAELSDVDEFYYALGWLAKHIGSMTAILPDYLGASFEKYFGAEAPKTLVDGRAKTSGGYAKQWSWEFKCTIKKLKETAVPAYIQSVTTDFSKGIHNTAFLWDLVANYGFQFGKKQDVDKIREAIPAQYISSFETGLIA